MAVPARPAFSKATARLLDAAEAKCQRRGARLTALRREVLGLVLDSPRPAGAYDLLDRLRTAERRAAPPTVYRALDFLLEQGLIHKIERLAAYVGCAHGIEEAGEAPHPHAAQFLICRRCGQATELSDHRIDHALIAAAKGRGFALSGCVVEAEGVCAACAGLSAA